MNVQQGQAEMEHCQHSLTVLTLAHRRSHAWALWTIAARLGHPCHARQPATTYTYTSGTGSLDVFELVVICVTLSV